MKKILKKRETGKTAELIHMSANKDNWPTIIVCRSFDEVDRVWRQAQSMGLEIPQPITFSHLRRGKFEPSAINGFLIDNADMLLQSLGGSVPLKAFTMTVEEGETE